jgi:phage tail-like protein
MKMPASKDDKAMGGPQSRRAALSTAGLAAAAAFVAKSKFIGSAWAAGVVTDKASTAKDIKASTAKASTTPAKASTAKASTTQRFDPYKNFKFRVKWDGRYVAGVSTVGGLKRTTESTSRNSPGRTVYEAITLERGVTHDREFEQWASKASSKGFRKDIIIERYNEAGRLVETNKIFRCWVSEYQALPDLDANANAVAIQHLKLENEGWQRDYD